MEAKTDAVTPSFPLLVEAIVAIQTTISNAYDPYTFRPILADQIITIQMRRTNLYHSPDLLTQAEVQYDLVVFIKSNVCVDCDLALELILSPIENVDGQIGMDEMMLPEALDASQFGFDGKRNSNVNAMR